LRRFLGCDWTCRAVLLTAFSKSFDMDLVSVLSLMICPRPDFADGSAWVDIIIAKTWGGTPLSHASRHHSDTPHATLQAGNRSSDVNRVRIGNLNQQIFALVFSSP